MQGIPTHLTVTTRHLQQRCAEICSSSKAFLDLIAAGDDRVCKLVAARGPNPAADVLQRQISASAKSQQRRVFFTEEKKSEMRWQTADYIARRPSHFGELWRAA